jgi:glucose/arabinose dehydrogenase
MNHRLLTIIAMIILAAALWACNRTNTVEADSSAADFQPETVLENLDTPWGMDFLPDGTMVFTERGGRVSMFANGERRGLGSIQVNETAESGLLGIAVDPDYQKNRFVYLYYTYSNGNRVSRFILDGQLSKESVLLDGIPSAPIHDGGRVRFGPDGMLYITTGDAGHEEAAQDMDSLSGKILRMNKNGSDLRVYAYGIRNAQGITWDEKGVMYASDHGPTRHDEINIIREGGNYGWPNTCEEDPKTIHPIRCYTDFTLAPGSLEWAMGALYVTGLAGEQLRRITVRDGRVTREEILVRSLGRLRALVAHEGYLYFSTSNRDGRGSPAANDDQILRVKVR